jgi:hypothetical protein
MGLHQDIEESSGMLDGQANNLQFIKQLEDHIQNCEHDSIQEMTEKIKQFLYNTSMK